ncbi:MAG: PH domain-containing protein [Alphaproteobacteria bacterium]|nr:PH domain-containing protein [Alphaproteobacteria bacterium]
MSYVSRTLGSKERILYSTGYHWLYWLWAAILIVPSAAVAIGGYPYSMLSIVLLVIGLFILPFGLTNLIRAWATEIAVTTDRFIRKTGFVAIKSEEVSLDKIEEVTVDQSILGRIFGYGNVQVHGTGMGDIRCRMVDSPIYLRRQIQTAREGLKSKTE